MAAVPLKGLLAAIHEKGLFGFGLVFRFVYCKRRSTYL